MTDQRPKWQRDPADVRVGGCPCNFWSVRNCAYVRARGICTAPAEIRPVP